MTDTDEPMPHLAMAQHRGHTLQQVADGKWTCDCGEWAVPASVEEPRAFGSWMLHASGASPAASSAEKIP